MTRFPVISPTTPRVYGHRGCRGLRPENTIPAFLHALHWPLDGLELDVVLSADNKVVVSHEPWLNAAICLDPRGQQLTAAAGAAFNLYQQPYAEIKRCDCGTLPHPAFPEQQPESAHKPLLSEVFADVATRCGALFRPLPAFSIELKSTPATDGLHHPGPLEFVQRVADELTLLLPLYPGLEVLLMSFDHRVIRAARQLTPWPVCLLIEDERPVPEHLARLGFQPDVLGPRYTLLTESLLSFCAQRQLPIVTWTVNDPATMRELVARGIAGMTTDYPDRAAYVFAL